MMYTVDELEITVRLLAKENAENKARITVLENALREHIRRTEQW